jgi:hypothetical protein
MKKRFSDEQIIAMLKEQEASVGRVIFYQWIVQAFDINPNGLIMRRNGMPSNAFAGNAAANWSA